MSPPLYKRAIIDEIVRYLHTDEILVIHGARQVGKTSILSYLQNHLQLNEYPTLYLDLEDSRLIQMIDKGVDEFLTYLAEIICLD
jgi:predicted AAA+ superfamily ATPase